MNYLLQKLFCWHCLSLPPAYVSSKPRVCLYVIFVCTKVHSSVKQTVSDKKIVLIDVLEANISSDIFWFQTIYDYLTEINAESTEESSIGNNFFLINQCTILWTFLHKLNCEFFIHSSYNNKKQTLIKA